MVGHISATEFTKGNKISFKKMKKKVKRERIRLYKLVHYQMVQTSEIHSRTGERWLVVDLQIRYHKTEKE